MIDLGSRIDQAKVLEALEDPNGIKGYPVVFFNDAPTNYGERLQEATWGQSDKAIGLQGIFSGILPRRLENAILRLYIVVNGVMIPQMNGRYSEFEINDDYASTKFNAATGGGLLSSIKLNERVEYSDDTPEAILQDALFRAADVEAYDKSEIEIEGVGTPLLSFDLNSAFKPEESCDDVISRVVQAVPQYLVRDTVYKGTRARIDRGPGDPNDSVLYFDSSRLPNWRPPKRDARQYSEVQVYREGTDGDDVYREVAPIEYIGVDNPPIANTPLQIPLNDVTSDGPRNAAQIATDQAIILGRGVYKGTDLNMPGFYPLVEIWDGIRVYAPQRDDDGLWEKLWQLRVDSYSHTRQRVGQAGAPAFSTGEGTGSSGSRGTGDPPGLATKISYTATILEEDLIDTPAYLGLTISPNVLQGPQPAYGTDATGFWYDDTTAIGINGSPYIGIDSTGAWIDPDNSGGAVGHDGVNGFWFEI